MKNIISFFLLFVSVCVGAQIIGTDISQHSFPIVSQPGFGVAGDWTEKDFAITTNMLRRYIEWCAEEVEVWTVWPWEDYVPWEDIVLAKKDDVVYTVRTEIRDQSPDLMGFWLFINTFEP